MTLDELIATDRHVREARASLRDVRLCQEEGTLDSDSATDLLARFRAIEARAIARVTKRHAEHATAWN